MADDLMESIEPFNISGAVDFQTAYLAGYLADKYDVTAEQSIERANKRVKYSTEEAFAETVKGYATVTTDNSSVQFHGGKAKYALYPVNPPPAGEGEYFRPPPLRYSSGFPPPPPPPPPLAEETEGFANEYPRVIDNAELLSADERSC